MKNRDYKFRYFIDFEKFLGIFDKMIAKFSFICYTHLWTKLNSLNKRKFLIFHK